MDLLEAVFWRREYRRSVMLCQEKHNKRENAYSEVKYIGMNNLSE